MICKKLIRDIFLFFIIGIIYVFIEILFRGYSHWSMFILAGICGVFIDKLNNVFSYDFDIVLQCSICAFFCSILEGYFGVLFNIILDCNIWDYSNVPGPVFFCGQVSLLFSFIWFLLSFVCIIICDSINYYIFNLYEQPYYKLFGRILFKLPNK